MNKDSVFIKQKAKKSLKYLYIMAFFGLVGWNISFFMQQPTQIDDSFVVEAIKLSQDTNLPLYNDPSFGYWIQAHGVQTPYNPGTFLDPPEGFPGIYLTDKEMPPCVLIKEEKRIRRKKINIFQCN